MAKKWNTFPTNNVVSFYSWRNMSQLIWRKNAMKGEGADCKSAVPVFLAMIVTLQLHSYTRIRNIDNIHVTMLPYLFFILLNDLLATSQV